MTFGKCVYGKQDQVAYAYGEMKPDEAEAFKNHLESCPRCLRAVSELAEAAALCHKLKNQPSPELAWTRPAPAGLLKPPPRKQEGPRPLVWMPAGTALAALIVVVAVVALCQPIRPPEPGRGSAVAADPGSAPGKSVASTAGSVRQPARAAVRGTGRIPRAGAPDTVQFEHVARLGAGDILDTPEQAPADVALPDGSSLKLAATSSLRVDALASAKDGDRLELLRGRVECRVAPRPPERPFSVAAGPGVVTVKGTRFVVRLGEDDTLTVGVLEGVVELAPRANPAAARTVRAGSLATLAGSTPVQIGRLDLAARLRLFAGGTAGADDGMGGRDTAGDPGRNGIAAESAAGSRAAGPGTVAEAATGDEATKRDVTGAGARRGRQGQEGVSGASRAASEQPGGGDAVSDWAQGLPGHSSLFFDAFRSEMHKGRFGDALRKIENYLSDPESPDRAEAVYLRAVCLEKLGRHREAARVCRDYLERWPRGPRAAGLRVALLRLEQQDPQD